MVAGVKSWAVLSAGALVASGLLVTGKVGDRRLLLPGATTDGHYQIEAACESCHGAPFAGVDEIDAACVRCHGAALTAADDSHRRGLFTDPRNAERFARLDARRCTTCHREHWPEGTRTGGVTVAEDHCAFCHDDIARERPSHEGLESSSCASSGCHKYHDNRGLYEEFLVEHAGEPALRAPARRMTGHRSIAGARPSSAEFSRGDAPRRPLSRADADAPAEHAVSEAELAAWVESQHALSGVNCRGCHAPGGEWSDSVGVAVCGSCHGAEHAGWMAGRHGMRAAAGLEAMRPELARLSMRPAAGAEPLGCTSCHGAHGFDRTRAAVDACQRCHSDAHTLAYAASPHAKAWRAELAFEAPSGSGVSCATCHLPRVAGADDRVQHDQNDNLRPREKMIRSVCLDCHGLAFAIDALADQRAIDDNFAEPPRAHVASIDWALARAVAPTGAHMLQDPASDPAPQTLPGSDHAPPSPPP